MEDLVIALNHRIYHASINPSIGGGIFLAVYCDADFLGHIDIPNNADPRDIFCRIIKEDLRVPLPRES